MERREFLKSLGLGMGAALAATQAVALTRLSPPDLSSGEASAEPAFYRGSWRHERRRHRQYGREEYGHGKKKKNENKKNQN